MSLNIQPAVKKETLNVALYTVVGDVLLVAVYALLGYLEPDYFHFSQTVIFGALVGGIIAVLNFFLMGMTVQKVAATENEDNAKNFMKGSYQRRLLLQLVWIVVAIAAPCFNWIAGILPLMFPSLGIKLKGIISNSIYSKKQE